VHQHDHYIVASEGILCTLGASLSMNIMPIKLLMNRITVTGSAIGSNAGIRAMLDFW
jgi:D-arabinose 1-dehydrogenase-like Zn-dependent alcohol dehydrogenase